MDNAALYGYKLNARESWTLINRIAQRQNNNTILRYKIYLQNLIRESIEGFGEITVVFLTDKGAYESPYIQNTDSFTIVFGLCVPNGATDGEFARIQRDMPDDIRALRRLFRTEMDLRLDFCSSDSRLWFGHLIPEMTIHHVNIA